MIRFFTLVEQELFLECTEDNLDEAYRNIFRSFPLNPDGFHQFAFEIESDTTEELCIALIKFFESLKGYNNFIRHFKKKDHSVCLRISSKKTENPSLETLIDNFTFGAKL